MQDYGYEHVMVQSDAYQCPVNSVWYTFYGQSFFSSLAVCMSCNSIECTKTQPAGYVQLAMSEPLWCSVSAAAASARVTLRHSTSGPSSDVGLRKVAAKGGCNSLQGTQMLGKFPAAVEKLPPKFPHCRPEFKAGFHRGEMRITLPGFILQRCLLAKLTSPAIYK